MRPLHPVLRVRALKKEYLCGTAVHPSLAPVFHGIDLDAYGGEILTLAAPQGWGKSTLLLCLAGLLRPTSGSVQWAFPHTAADQELRSPRTSGILYLSQRPSYYDFLSVREALDYYSLASSSPATIERALDDAIERTGLAAVEHIPIKKLPESLLRRLQVAEALMFTPKALLLDETLTNVDPATFAVLRQLVVELAASGTVVVIATRDVDLARHFGSRQRSLFSVSGHAARTTGDFVPVLS